MLKIPFTSSRKRASIIVHQPEADESRQVRVYTKGGPDFLMPRVTQMLDGNCEAQSIEASCEIPEELENVELDAEQFDDGDFKTLVNKTVKSMAQEAFRTILVCYRDMSMEEFENLKADNNNFETDEDRECLEDGLTAIGIYGI